MRINVKTPITNYEGEDIKTEIGVLTLGFMMVSGLNTPQESDKGLSADKKIARAVLSLDIHNSLKESNDGTLDISQEDVVLVKELINLIYAPLPLMRAFDILDPKPIDAAQEG